MPDSRVVVALPLYQTVPVEWLFSFLNADRSRWAGSVATTDVYLMEAMTKLVGLAFSNYGDADWDRLVVWEHDMIVPAGAFERIANYPPECDIVGSIYFQHKPPYRPYVYMRAPNPDDGYCHVATATVKHLAANPAVYPVDAVGFGFTSIHRRVLERWDQSVEMFRMDPASRMRTHDFWFCSNAQAQGFNVNVDSGIVCEHLSAVPIGLADHERCPQEGIVVAWEDGQVKPFDLGQAAVG